MAGLLDAVSNVDIELLHVSIFRHINLTEPLVFINKTTVSITGLEDALQKSRSGAGMKIQELYLFKHDPSDA